MTDGIIERLNGGGRNARWCSAHTGRSPFTVTRVPERVCGR
jgi:hypothetical protein